MANQTKLGEVVFGVGDLVKVHQKIIEKEKERVQVFEGIVIAIRGKGENKSFTVRRIAAGGIGVERIWPLNSPWLLKLEVVKKGQVRRAKLYYLRKRTGRKAVRIKAKEEKKPIRSTSKKAQKTADEKKKPRKAGRKSGRQSSAKK